MTEQLETEGYTVIPCARSAIVQCQWRTAMHEVDAAEHIARSVPCPVCDALTGMGCWRNDGRSGERRTAHAARYRLALDTDDVWQGDGRRR